jgi:hypothetical protein
MKAISNLSCEVMTLNQIGLRDHQVDVSETQKFLGEMNTIIDSKCRGNKIVFFKLIFLF